VCVSAKWALGAGIAGIGVYLFARYFEWKNIYFPSRDPACTPKDAGLEFEDIDFITEDARLLHGWWIPHPQARGTIVHCHGNAGNIGDRVWLAADLHRLNVNVLLFDYRGYGWSRGVPTEQGTYADARAAFEVARAKHGDSDTPPIIVHGQSLGGAVAVQLALDRPARGLIVESSFTSVPEMAKRLYPGLPLHRLVRFRYDSLAKIAQVKVPKLIAHSATDDLVPFDMGRRLFEAASEPKEFVQLAGGHNEAGWATSPGYWSALERFVARVLS
jgi:fermentation-respiration switch protein FrsA (DUF1100 family)